MRDQFKVRIAEEFWKTAEFVVVLVGHFVSIAALLLSIKGIEKLLFYLWDDGGLKIAKGTPYEFSIKTLFEASEFGVFLVLAVAGVLSAFRLWFGEMKVLNKWY